MRNFPKKIYVTAYVSEDDDILELAANADEDFLEDEEEDNEIAVYQLVKTGRVKKTTKIVFE